MTASKQDLRTPFRSSSAAGSSPKESLRFSRGLPEQSANRPDERSSPRSTDPFGSRWSFANIPVHPPPRVSSKESADAAEHEAVHRDPSFEVTVVARHGVQDNGTALPYFDRIQASFGHHEIGSVQAHFGQTAADANRRLRSRAYTFGNHVAFAATPTLETAAHEAAHVVQQRMGLHPSEGLRQPDDLHELQADAVADSVVRGMPASPILDRISRAPQNAGASAVQLQREEKQALPQIPEIPGLRRSIQQWIAIDEIKRPIVLALANEYVNRPGRIEMPDRVIAGTPYGNKIIPGYHEPNAERVYFALYPAMNLQKIGKGEKTSDWSFTWAGAPTSPSKTRDERDIEIAKFAVVQTASQVNDFLGPATEFGLTGTTSTTSIIESISKPAVKWIIEDVLLLSAEVTVRAIPVVAALWLAYDILELATSLNEPTEKKTSETQMENESIVAGVKAYLTGKKEAAAAAAARQRPVLFDIKPAVRDKSDLAH